MARMKARSGRAADKRCRGEAILDENRCRACGACNPSLIGEAHPEACASCGSDLQVRDVSCRAFRAKTLKVTEEGIEIRVNGRKVQRKGNQRLIDIALDQEKPDNPGKGHTPANKRKRNKGHN